MEKITSEIKPLVAVIMGSDSDLSVMEETLTVLEEFGVLYELRILSAHRVPRETSEYAQFAEIRGLKVLIAGAGHAAHLAGALAAQTILPVIGVPIDSSPLKGVDALYSTVQMPPGIPVGTMAIGKSGAQNAALFAIQILALQDNELAAKLRAYKQAMIEKVEFKQTSLDGHMAERMERRKNHGQAGI